MLPAIASRATSIQERLAVRLAGSARMGFLFSRGEQAGADDARVLSMTLSGFGNATGLLSRRT